MPQEALRILEVTSPEGGRERLDRALASTFEDLSRSRLQQLVREGRVRVDGAVVSEPSARIGPGAAIRLEIPEAQEAAPAPETITLSVAYEDDDLIVVDKPAGLVVHPGPGNERGTMVNALLAHCGASLSGIGGVKRPGIVHRLDKNTSGLMVVAKNDAAHRALSAQFADHGRTGPLERAYLALAWGVPEAPRGTIDAPLGRGSQHREKMAVLPPGKGRHAVTHYRVLEPFHDAGGEALASMVECRLETGRTHQIRVHFTHIGHPLLGDETYGTGFKTKANRLGPEAGGALATLGRQALHAAVLGFAHPRTGAHIRFESPLPPELEALADALRRPI